jgi:hypothetical protein
MNRRLFARSLLSAIAGIAMAQSIALGAFPAFELPGEIPTLENVMKRIRAEMWRLTRQLDEKEIGILAINMAFAYDPASAGNETLKSWGVGDIDYLTCSRP